MPRTVLQGIGYVKASELKPNDLTVWNDKLHTVISVDETEEGYVPVQFKELRKPVHIHQQRVFALYMETI